MMLFLGDLSVAFTARDHKDKRIAFSYLDMYLFLRGTLRFRKEAAEYESKTKRLAELTKFVDERPNLYLQKAAFAKQVKEHEVLSPLKTFTENFRALKQANPGEVSSTNIFASIEYFVKLVKDGKCHVEDLPQALLYLTDNENNTGLAPKEAVQLANSIGWQPLLVFWGISNMPSDMMSQIKNVPNVLAVSGFTEGALSQILRGIKSGSINIETELWSIYEDKRYSVLS